MFVRFGGSGRQRVASGGRRRLRPRRSIAAVSVAAVVLMALLPACTPEDIAAVDEWVLDDGDDGPVGEGDLAGGVAGA